MESSLKQPRPSGVTQDLPDQEGEENKRNKTTIYAVGRIRVIRTVVNGSGSFTEPGSSFCSPCRQVDVSR